jgi:hypothetical protein
MQMRVILVYTVANLRYDLLISWPMADATDKQGERFEPSARPQARNPAQ